MSDENLPAVVADVYPVIPDDFNESILNDAFWEEIGKELRSGTNLREFIFDLWAGQCDADIIMKIVGMNEEDLDAIIPRSKWLTSKWVKCRRCGGRGGTNIKVTWEQREKS